MKSFIYKRSNGVYYAQMTHANGKVVQRSLKTTDEAQARRVLASYSEARTPAGVEAHTPGGARLSDLLPMYLTASSRLESLPKVSASLMHTISALGDPRPTDLSPRIIRAWQRDLGTRLLRVSVTRYWSNLAVFLKWLVAEELAPLALLAVIEACRSLSGVAPRRSAPRRCALEADVTAAALRSDMDMAALIWVLWHTGARVGEMLQLRPNLISRSGPTASFSPPHHKGSHAGTSRTVYLGPQALAALAPLLDQTEPDRLVWPWTYSVYWRRLSELNPGFTFHQLRHSLATRMRDKFDLDTAQAILGHSSSAMTERYAEVSTDNAARAALTFG